MLKGTPSPSPTMEVPSDTVIVDGNTGTQFVPLYSKTSPPVADPADNKFGSTAPMLKGTPSPSPTMEVPSTLLSLALAMFELETSTAVPT